MAIGIVRALVGTTTVSDSRGTTRVLRVGDAVELNDTVQTSAGSTILIQFDNGGFATVAGGDRLLLDQSVLDPSASAKPVQGDEQSVADIQAMIAAGMDPTQIAEATAAGADAGTAGDPGHSGSHSFVVVNQEGARGDVTPGFGTDTTASPLNTAATQTADPRFFINPDAGETEPANNAPIITERGGNDSLNLKEAGVGTVEQGGKPGWAIGDHNHAIAGTPQADGWFKVTDADNDPLSARLTDKNGNPVDGVTVDANGVMTLETEYGTLTVTPTANEDGSVTYSYSFELNGNANSLNEGESVHYDYNIEVSDGRGGTVSENVNVNIDGTNDAPTIKFDSVHVKEEGADTSAVGGNDGFVGDNHHRFVVHGDLSQKSGDVDADSRLTYSISIQAGEKNLETASTGGEVIRETDGTNATVELQVLSNETVDGIQTIVTNYGTLTLNTLTGEYTFELNTAPDSPANGLGAGEFLNLGFGSTVTDQFGAIGQHTVRVTIEGSNDAPTLSVPDKPLDVYQGGSEHAFAGAVTGSDVDHGAKLTYSFGTDGDGNPVTTIETPYGTVTINPDTGEYTYEVKPGSTDKDVTDKFNVRVTDEHGAYDEKSVSVNVHPNQAPVISGDAGDPLSMKEAGVGTVGEGGKPGWAIGEHNHEIAGNKVAGSSFKVSDADGDKLTATLLDRDGKPVEGVQTDASGKMTVQTDYGVLTVTPVENADGTVTYTYHYELDNKLADSLKQDETAHEKFEIRISDGHGGTLTHPVDITITGTNDAPTFNGRGQNIQVKEEGVFDGNKPTTDDHRNDGFVHEQNSRPKVSGDLSKYVTDADHDVLTYSVNHFNVRNTSVDRVETALYTGSNNPVIDATTGKPVTVNVEMLGSPTTDASGTQTIHTNYGTLTVDTRTGHYTFELGGDEEADKLVNSLGAGEKFTFQFETLVTDWHGAIGKHLLTVVVEGANDAPTLNVGDNPVVSQDTALDTDGNISVIGNAEGSDTDRGAELKYSFGPDEKGQPKLEIEGTYGKLVIDPDTGEYKYVLNAGSDAYKGLGDNGDTDRFTVRVTDEHGAFSEQDLTINVTGAPVPVLTDHVSVNEAGLNDVGNTSEIAAIKVPDGYEVVNSPEGKYEGKYGSLVQNGSGQWEYRLDSAFHHESEKEAANTALDADTVTVKVAGPDGKIHDMNVTVDIVDDVPHLNVTEKGSTINDNGDVLFQGSLTINYGADGVSTVPGGMDIRVNVAGSEFPPFIFRVSEEGEFINDSVKIVGDDGTVYGDLTLVKGVNGHYDYSYLPASGHERDNVKIELSVSDNDGDTTVGTIVIDPPVPVNHAPEVSHVSVEVGYENQLVHVDGSDRMITRDLLSHSTHTGVRVDTGNDLFSKYVGMDLNAVKASAEVVHGWQQYNDLVNKADCPKVIWVDGSLPVDGILHVPADTIVIVNGDLNINGSPTNVGAGIEGILFVANNFNLNQNRFELTDAHADSALVLVQGKVQSNANISAQGSGDLDTTIQTDTEQVLLDLNKTFTDADGDRMSFTADGSSLPDGYRLSLVDGVLKITGKDGSFGHHAVTVTATDEKGESTSVTFDINVNGHHVDITATLIGPITPSSLETMMSSMAETGSEHVTDAITHQPLDGNHHDDTVDGMIAAADMIEHGTAGHDMLTGSHGHDVLYGEGGHDLMVGDGSGTTVDALAGLVHTDSTSESVLNAIHSMSPEELKGLSFGMETLEHQNDGHDVLMGGAGNDVLIGMGGNDVLHGGEGHDILLGGAGDDILVGGKGDDVMVGGLGHDTFQYHQGDLDGVVNGDHILDFHLGNLDGTKGPLDANADVLDIGDLLHGSGAKADGSDLFSGGFLQLEVLSHDEEKGTATVRLTIDQDGASGNEHGNVPLATIEMNGVHGLGGLNPQDQADHLMQQLMNNQSIRM